MFGVFPIEKSNVAIILAFESSTNSPWEIRSAFKHNHSEVIVNLLAAELPSNSAEENRSHLAQVVRVSRGVVGIVHGTSKNDSCGHIAPLLPL